MKKRIFTGLYDKNKKKIYVGDIVQEDFYISHFKEDEKFDPKYIMKGKWIPEKQKDIFEIKSLQQIYYYLKEISDISSPKMIKKCNRGSCLKIIGNIHDNPDLLK
jgi:uncharacterized phage protein (TIGR01671 family)